MEQRYATDPAHVRGMGTTELRERFLVPDLFADDEVRAVYTHHDRVVLVGASPVSGPLALPVYNVAVHAGPARAGEFLVRALNQNGASLAGNRIDDNVLAAVAKAPLADLIDDVIDLYEDKLRAHPNFAHFKNGFMRRAKKLRIEMAPQRGEDLQKMAQDVMAQPPEVVEQIKKLFVQ